MEQRLITGQPAADGVVMCTSIVTTAPHGSIDRNHAGGDAEYTLADLDAAVQETQAQLRRFQQRIQERITESVTLIFDAHLMILEDPSFIEKIRDLIKGGVRVPDAINRVTDECIALFARSANVQVREKTDDIEDLTLRLLHNLGHPAGTAADIDYHGRILITPRLFPSDLLRFVAQNAEGVILTSGGITAHISVLACCLEMPMILADAALLAGIDTGTTILMDAHTGKIHINPAATVVASYADLLETHGKASSDAGVIEPQTHTRDGRRIRLLAAIGLISEAKLAHELHAEGIGLYRSEMPFLISNRLPSEDEQYTIYRTIMQEMAEGDIIFRTLDIGGDKILRHYPAEEESNPFLGLRGIRFTFHHREVFSTQVRALLKAGHDHPLKIMFPLVSSVDSFMHARNLVKDSIRDLQSENVPHQPHPELGAMIELPSAVSLADELAAEADFLSIGTNDLVQYMLAVDRTNPKVAGWYVPWHPAIFRAIKTVVDAAHRHGKPVSICGDMASDPKLIPVLIGMGITKLTVPPRRIPQVQRLIKTIDAAAAGKLAEKILGVASVAEIGRILDIPWDFPGS